MLPQSIKPYGIYIIVLFIQDYAKFNRLSLVFQMNNKLHKQLKRKKITIFI